MSGFSGSISEQNSVLRIEAIEVYVYFDAGYAFVLVYMHAVLSINHEAVGQSIHVHLDFHSEDALSFNRQSFTPLISS